MADSPALKKPKPKAVTDWLNRPRSEKTDLVKQRTELWDAVNRFVIEQGGWITSVPGARNLRIEISQGSPLPAKLRDELGFDPRHYGVNTRIEAGKILCVDVIEIVLGK